MIHIDPNICKQCGICKKNCPTGAINGEIRQGPFEINQNKCIKCGVCITKCPFKAISK
jgi:NADP-reducing hydrogenase subunit HndC